MTETELVRFLRPYCRSIDSSGVETVYHWLVSNLGAHPAIDKLHRVASAILADGTLEERELEDLRHRIENAVSAFDAAPYLAAPNLDPHGQPILPFTFNRLNNERKSVDELVGFARGVLADGIVNDDEARAFRVWIQALRKKGAGWPIDDLAARLDRIFADGKIDNLEREELRQIMLQLGGFSETLATRSGIAEHGSDGPLNSGDCKGLQLEGPGCRPNRSGKQGGVFPRSGPQLQGSRQRVATQDRRGGWRDHVGP